MNDLTSTVAAARNGDLDAFSRLVACFQGTAYAFAYGWLRNKELAEEAVQDAFVEVFFSLSNLREPAAFPGWLRVIVFRCCDRLSRGKQPQTVPLAEAAEAEVEAKDPESLLETKQLQGWLQKALLRLREQERLTVSLFYMGGYRQAEIAVLLKEPVGRIKKRLYNVRRRLRDQMMQEVEHYFPGLQPSLNDQFVRQVQQELPFLVPLGRKTGSAGSGSLTLDGVNDYVVSQLLINITTNSITLEAWVCPTQSSSAEQKVAGFHTAPNRDVYFSLQNGGVWFVVFDPSGAAHKLWKAGLGTNRWYHLCGTYDGKKMRLYIDGAEVTACDFGEHRSFNDGFQLSSPLYLSVDPYLGSGQHFTGLMDEVRVWDYARSGVQISAARSHVLQGDENGLVLYYSFDDGNAGQVTDLTGHGFDGRLVGGAGFSADGSQLSPGR